MWRLFGSLGGRVCGGCVVSDPQPVMTLADFSWIVDRFWVEIHTQVDIPAGRCEVEELH